MIKLGEIVNDQDQGLGDFVTNLYKQRAFLKNLQHKKRKETEVRKDIAIQPIL